MRLFIDWYHTVSFVFFKLYNVGFNIYPTYIYFFKFCNLPYTVFRIYNIIFNLIFPFFRILFFYFLPIYGWPIFIVAIVAGLAHSNKSAIYEFYKSEYLLFAGPFESANIDYPEDFKEKIQKEPFSIKKILMYSYLDYTRRQFWISTRSREQRERFRTLAYSKENEAAFTARYKELNKPIMFWWALICGTNTHRTLIMLLSLIGRFDIYLIIVIITILIIITFFIQSY